MVLVKADMRYELLNRGLIGKVSFKAKRDKMLESKELFKEDRKCCGLK